MKINKIAPETSKFLQITTTIAKPPKSLYLLGSLPAERKPTVAIIGTRKYTAYGRDVGYRLAYDLAARGVVIVSGLALGMDAMAHQAAVDAGGTTIAVMACGLANIYPMRHRQLALDILRTGGALISEYEPEERAYQSRFIERNRIVAGLSDGVLVIEAAAKSGTMHTANFALEQGRAVMAVPGAINNPMSEGCNNLIKTGARLITDASEVLDELGLSGKPTQQQLPLGATQEEDTLLQLMATGITDGHELQQKSRLAPTVFNQTMTMLEISAKIRPLGGNNWGIK